MIQNLIINKIWDNLHPVVLVDIKVFHFKLISIFIFILNCVLAMKLVFKQTI